MALEAKPIYRFGPYTLDPARRRLERDGKPVPLTTRGFDTLVALVENHGRVVTKEELIRSVWQDAFVEENNLNQAVSALRRALHQGSNADRFIDTVPRRGYAFVADVVEVMGTPPRAGEVESGTTPFANDDDLGQPSAVPAPRRHHSRRALALALGAGAGAVAVVALLLARPARSGRALAGVRSVAVLPFQPLAMERQDHYLGLALADAVITRLVRLERLSVRPTTAVSGFEVAGRDPVAAGRALGVDAVLDGRIQGTADRVRVTVQLVRVDPPVSVWSRQFDVSRSDLFRMEDSIADAVAMELGTGLDPARQAARPRPGPPAPGAYEAYLRGRYEWNGRTQASLERSERLFREPTGADPTFARAWAGLADANNLLGRAPEAKAAALRALELDPELGEAEASLANVALFYDFDFTGAERRFRRAIALSPSYATARQWYAYLFVATRRFDEALAEIQRARELDPLSLSIMTDIGDILYYSGRYADAEREIRQALARDERFAQARNVLAEIHLAQGDNREAAIRELSGDTRHDFLALAYARAGRTAEARAMLARAPDRSAVESTQRLVRRSAVLLALGERQEALDALEQAYREHCGEFAMIAVNPQLSGLRSDPRFVTLLRRARLEP